MTIEIIYIIGMIILIAALPVSFHEKDSLAKILYWIGTGTLLVSTGIMLHFSDTVSFTIVAMVILAVITPSVISFEIMDDFVTSYLITVLIIMLPCLAISKWLGESLLSLLS